MAIVIPISKSDHARIAVAIKSAEARTAAEIVCVLARRASDYAYVPPLWAAVVALIAPWPMILFTSMSVRAIFASQISVFIVAALIFSWRPLRFALAPRFIKRERARRAAFEQFYTRGVANTTNRAGVLIFVSLAERYAHIVADESVCQKVAQEEWRGPLDVLCSHLHERRIADGFIEAIDGCADILSGEFPPGGENELPDKIYVI